MKKLAIVLGSVMLIAAIAYPVFAHGPGWWRGHQMMGYGAGGAGDCWGAGRGTSNLTPEQQERMDQLNQKFYNDTNSIRNEIWSKSEEVGRLLDSPDPDVEKLKFLQKDISELRAQMGEKRLDYELEARKVAPEGTYAGGYGSGYKKGYGKGSGKGYGKGYGRGRGGYGRGACWQ